MKVKLKALLLPLGVVLLALGLALNASPYLAYVATSWLIFGLLALSLEIVWGHGGLLSLGQTAFYGLGGYCGSIAAINAEVVLGQGNTLWISIPVGALAGALTAAALGYIVFYVRMGPLQSTILTYTFTLLLWTVTQSLSFTAGEAVIGGDNGMSNIPGLSWGFGENWRLLEPNEGLILVIVVATAIYFISQALRRSIFGRVVSCIRIDPAKAELLGYDIRKYQLLNFAYAGAVAAIAGVLYGSWAAYLNPSIFSVQEALLVPIYVLVGGLGLLSAPFVGAITVGGLSFSLGGGAVGGQTTLILGIALILLVLFLKHGILGTLLKKLPYFVKANPKNQHDSTQPVAINTLELEQILKDSQKYSGKSNRLVLSKLFKRFGGVIPVNDVSLEFAQGNPQALIGPNGAGKSSCLKTCMGVYKADYGQIILGGQDITKMQIFNRVRMGLGVKNQKPQVFGELSVAENLWIAAYANYRNAEQSDQISNKVMRMLGLDTEADTLASSIAHGAQQWLDIGMVLCLAPRVFLLDEPAAGMTGAERRELSLLVRTLAKYNTVVVVEHDIDFVRTLGGEVFVLHQGQRFAQGSIDDLRKDDRVLNIYLGKSANA